MVVYKPVGRSPRFAAASLKRRTASFADAFSAAVPDNLSISRLVRVEGAYGEFGW